MTEGLKTGLFWALAVVVLGIATIVAWPVVNESETDSIVGKPLFAEFKDPLAAASMKIVTFDELQGTLASFEVRKDRQTGAWTIPSRKGYPADAVNQMKDAANALVDLKVLDIQTVNIEDHANLGVVEPAIEVLQIGDEGVGRLVVLKNESQNDLAALIIGDKVKNDPTKVYVRRPGQDPVYVVALDETPLTTRFQDWIEEDLLSLSSIEIDSIEIKDYSAILGQGAKISLSRNYTADVAMDGPDWKLNRLVEYDPNNPLAEPTPVVLGLDEELNSTKLNEIKDAIDDLKIVDVIRKPEGMSENLRADKELTSDNDAVESLMRRGFYPVQTTENGDIEVLSANGELTVSLKNGVKYILRFGNIEGVTSDEDKTNQQEEGDSISTGGVNRFLLVTTQVDRSKFPTPDLQEVPQTLEDLQALLSGNEEDDASAPIGLSEQSDASETEPGSEDAMQENADNGGQPQDETDAEQSESSEEEPAAEQSVAEEMDEELNGQEEVIEAEAVSDSDSGESQLEGSGETTGQDEAQADEAQTDEASSESDEVARDEVQSESDEASAEVNEAAEVNATEENAAESETAESMEETPQPEADSNAVEADAPAADEQLTEEEMLERLQSEQEKITKENQRKLDQQRDSLEAANRRVRDLNARFADWYYVIPEDTYRKLRIRREELIQPAGSGANAQPTGMPAGMPGAGGMPQFNFGPPGS